MARLGLRSSAALALAAGAAAFAVACASILGIDTVGYGDAALQDASNPPADAPTASDATHPDAGPPGCGPTQKSCIVCVAAQSVATGCSPQSCQACSVGLHADAACLGTNCGVGACQPPFMDCDDDAANGCEVDPYRGDPGNCGGCARTCAVGLLCQPDGGCATSCAAGRVPCDGGCIDTSSDPKNCQACGAACPGLGMLNTEVTCGAAGCISTCSNGFTDCNGAPGDGCECDPTSTCTDSVCTPCVAFLAGGCAAGGSCCRFPFAAPICASDHCCVAGGQPCGNNGWCCSGSCGAGNICDP